jgi:hypothetical protein
MLGLSLLALAAQYPSGTAKFILFHGNNPGSPEAAYFEAILRCIKQEVIVANNHDVPRVMDDLAKELQARQSGAENAQSAPAIFVFVHGLQKFKKLRSEDDFSFSMSDSDSSNPGAQFGDLIAEGASHGMHLIVAVDTFNNINRFMSRKALSEFEMRVIFQMSANDSASLIDSPKAGNLGLHRALFYNEQEGHLETFRPYATPDSDWLNRAEKAMKDR